MLFVLLVMILLFSVLTSIPYAVALSTSLLGSESSLLLPPLESMSSANRRLYMGLPAMEMDVGWSWTVFCMIFSRNQLIWIGESRHPWRTHTVALKKSPRWLFKTTALLKFSYNAWMAWTTPSSMLKLLRTCQRPACQTLSDAFLKSTKLSNWSRRCCRCSYLTHSFILRKEEAIVCVTCHAVITVKHILIECADLLEIRKKYFEERYVYSLFRNVIQERIFDFLWEIGVFYKIWSVLR